MSNEKVVNGLDTAADEALIFLVKAFRGAKSMDDPGNRVLASTAGSMVGAWTRYQATESQREQTDLVRSAIFAREIGGKQTDYLRDAPAPMALTEG